MCVTPLIEQALPNSDNKSPPDKLKANDSSLAISLADMDMCESGDQAFESKQMGNGAAVIS